MQALYQAILYFMLNAFLIKCNNTRHNQGVFAVAFGVRVYLFIQPQKFLTVRYEFFWSTALPLNTRLKTNLIFLNFLCGKKEKIRAEKDGMW